MDQSLNVSWADSPNKVDEDPNQKVKTLYVSNVPIEISEDALRNVFLSYGTIVKCTIVKDLNTGESKGFGFVEFSDRGSCANAVNALNNTEISGKTISVVFANPHTHKLKQKSKNWNKGGNMGQVFKQHQFNQQRFGVDDKNRNFNRKRNNQNQMGNMNNMNSMNNMQNMNNMNNMNRNKMGGQNNFRKNKMNNNMQNQNRGGHKKPNNRNFQQHRQNVPMPMFNPQTNFMAPYGNMNANMDWRNLYPGINQYTNQTSHQYNKGTNGGGGDKYQQQYPTNYQYPNYPNYQDPNYSQYSAYYNQYMSNPNQLLNTTSTGYNNNNNTSNF
jgi:RNA recognition motif-containing protein